MYSVCMCGSIFNYSFCVESMLQETGLLFVKPANWTWSTSVGVNMYSMLLLSLIWDLTDIIEQSCLTWLDICH